MRSRGHSRGLRLAFVICIACIVAAFAASAAAVPAPSLSASGITALAGRAGAGATNVLASPLPALGGRLSALAGDVTPAVEVSPAIGAVYYWAGDYVYVIGLVQNDQSTAIGPVVVGSQVQDGSGNVIGEDIIPVAYNIRPGDVVAFKDEFYLPAYAGTPIQVGVATLALQPSECPDAVDLTLVTASHVIQPDGTRLWTCEFRNDSTKLVEGPILGGQELDMTGGILDCLWAYDGAAQIAPGASITMQVEGNSPDLVPDDASIYCQALPVPPLEPVFRFYNKRSGVHFYTPSAEERDRVIAQMAAVYDFEGVAYYTNPENNDQPLHRFYYRRGGSHFYSADPAEVSLIIAKWPDVFTYEGTTYRVRTTQVANSMPVYRFLNRKTSTHFYTASAVECEKVKSTLSSIYSYEGVGFWVGQ